jgi:primosomal protein N' (replication factor Y)
LIKIDKQVPLSRTKSYIRRVEKSFGAIAAFRGVRVIYNVDHI